MADDMGDGWSLLVEDHAASYRLDGRDIRELRKQIQAYEDRNRTGGHAHTRSSFELLYNMYQHDHACIVAGREIKVVITTTLPTWEARGRVPPELLELWNEAVALLVQHEAGHRAQALAAAESLREELNELAPQVDCERLRVTISHKLQWVSWNLNREAASYDARTRGGLEPDPLATTPAQQTDGMALP